MKLSNTQIELIELAVEKVFHRARARFLGRIPPNTPKKAIVSLYPDKSVASLFNMAAKVEGAKPNDELMAKVLRVSLGYLESAKEKAKSQTIQKVQAFLSDAQKVGVETDLKTVLGGELVDLWGKITSDVNRIVDTEASVAQNMSTTDAITKSNLIAGVRDPVVGWLCVHDQGLCVECKRLHLMSDKTTPRLWYLSEVGANYHRKGESNPKLPGLHPYDRCVMFSVLPGWGFDTSGKLTYISPGWDELKHQRK